MIKCLIQTGCGYSCESTVEDNEFFHGGAPFHTPIAQGYGFFGVTSR